MVDSIVGFDPGKNGAMAVLTLSMGGAIIDASVHPCDYPDYVSVLKNLHGSKYAMVERVHSMPQQGVASTFRFGEEYGKIQGILFGLEIEFCSVPPQTWKKEFGLLFPKGTDKREIKGASIAMAKKLFPGVSLKRTGRCKVESDGMAEAILIAEYGRRMLNDRR